MLARWLVSLSVVCASVCASHIRGVSPEGLSFTSNVKDQHLYEPVSKDGAQMFRCLHTDKLIPISAVNDDYCDCPDGSDEPGTSACPNGSFYCENKGFVPATIRSSRVNDGVCEPECCDGSDETDGKVQCPNVCAAKAAEAERKRKAQQKVFNLGARARASYIEHAQKEQAQHQKKLDELLREVASAQLRAEEFKRAFEKEEMSDQMIRDMQVQSPLYKQIEERHQTLLSLSRALNNAVEELRTVARIVEGVDNAESKEAYELWLGETEEGQALSLENKLDDIRDWAPATSDIENMANVDIIEMLDGKPGDALTEETKPGLWHIPSYLPETLVPVYEQVIAWILSTLVHLDILSPMQVRGKTAKALEAARAAHESSLSKVEELNNDIASHQSALKVQPEKYGRDNEFKALEGTCLSKDMGSYTYELCFGGKSTQISNNDGYRFDLGRFSHFDVHGQYDVSDDRHYLSMQYEHGQGCWNGPARSTRVTLECGATNELLKVLEAEKCTYTMHAKTPAVCFPVKTESDIADEARIDHEEL